ncbi:CHAT domain-containing protein [Dechloromonas sp. ZY10]|uniref:CHAT domain-containing protein n=1 Tax=Dechloromonas aquae TaxID=2664436 RepID=UPI003528EF11
MPRLPALVLLCLLPLFAGAAPETPAGKSKPRVEEVLAAFDSQPLELERIAKARQAAQAEIPANGEPAQLARQYWARARANGELGLVGAQLADMRRVIEFGGGDDPGRAWRELGQAELLGGDLLKAIEARRQAISLTPANQRGRQLGDHVALADYYRRLGQFSAARQQVEAAEKLLPILRNGKGWADNQYAWQMQLEDARGRVEFAAGHYQEAEARFRKALDWLDREAEQNTLRQADGKAGTPAYRLDNRRDGLENWLSQSLWKQGRLHEAEVHARNAAYNSLRRGGEDSLQAATNTQQLIGILSEQDRLPAALQLLERTQRTFDRQGLPPTAFFVARNQRLLGNTLSGLGRWQQAIEVFEKNRQALAATPELQEPLAGATLGWLRALIGVGRLSDAATMGEQLLAAHTAKLGPSAYETQEVRAYLASVLARQGRRDEALPLFREALATLLPEAAQADRSTRRFRRLAYLIESYLALLAEIRRSGGDPARDATLVSEAFRIADALRGQAVQQAMAASAARAAADTPALAALVREEQDARHERDALNAILADLMSRRADQTPTAIIGEMRERVSRLNQQWQQLGERIRREFPDYAELVTPKPATLANIQATLRPGEALLSLLASEEQTYLWAIPARGQVAFAAVPLPRATLNRDVARLRAALDPGEVELEKLPAFDGETAHRLYTQLLQPVAAGWQGAEHLIVAAGGSLGRLPLSLLLSAPPPAGKQPPAFAEYAAWPWLVKQMAISQLPAASSLPVLRGMRPGAAQRLALAAFGDPDFGEISRSTAKGRAFRSTLRSQGEAAPLSDYSRIPPLPDTRDEVLALARMLAADQSRDVFLGREASRQKVQQTPLHNRRVIAFATHGLLAGEYPGVDQPALALANPGHGEHGLLTLDDILGLKLDADWVILSACNTSAGDGQGGEAVSGLGRGFFYAGARSLLVTHWPVETVSARELVVGIFRALAARPELPRAKALQASMLQVMSRHGNEGGFRFSYAHPMFWAPYALVGDGGR